RKFVLSENQFAALHVDICDFIQPDASVPVTAEHVTQRRSDLPGRQRSGGHLIEQRLKQMVVAAIHKGHLDGRARQPLGGVEAAEAAPDNDYTMTQEELCPFASMRLICANNSNS